MSSKCLYFNLLKKIISSIYEFCAFLSLLEYKSCNISNKMRTIIQRVTAAKITVDEDLVSSIEKGICVLVGFCKTDTEKDVDYMTGKIVSLRLFQDEMGKRWKKSVKEKNFEILCVSQFTLYGRLKKNKPDFSMSMEGERANELYKSFLKKLGTLYEPNKIKDGKFGAYMQVHIQNDGPVTIELESPILNEKQNESKSSTEINNF